MPLIRVVIPTFNRALTVADALRTVLAQTFGDFEVLVVDDGSTDSTVAVVRRIAAKDTRIRLVEVEHGGAAKARNAGIESEGVHKYVAFLDSDDLWRPEHLERAVDVLESNPHIDVFCSRVEVNDVTGTWNRERMRDHLVPIRKPVQLSPRSLDRDLYFLDAATCRRAFVFSEFSPQTPSAVVRSRAVTRTPWFRHDLEVFEDTEFYFFMAVSGCAFVFDDSLHVEVRRFGDNLSGISDLRSPHMLRRLRSVLRYNKMKLSLCSSPEESDFVMDQIADTAYLIGQCSSEQSDVMGASYSYRESLQHRLSYKALKSLIRSIVFITAYSVTRRLKRVSIAKNSATAERGH